MDYVVKILKKNIIQINSIKYPERRSRPPDSPPRLLVLTVTSLSFQITLSEGIYGIPGVSCFYVSCSVFLFQDYPISTSSFLLFLLRAFSCLSLSFSSFLIIRSSFFRFRSDSAYTCHPWSITPARVFSRPPSV